MIEETEVRIIINQYNIKYYEDKLDCDLKIGQRINVPIDILPPTSGVKITVKCSYCGKTFKKAFRRYAETKDDVCCCDCKEQKILKNTIEKYGTRCTLTIPEVHERVINNNLKKYGTKSPMSDPKVREKTKNTLIQKYGVPYVFQSIECRAKANQTMYERGNNMAYTSKQQVHINDLLMGELNYPIGHYHIDSFIKEKNICVEYNGLGHDLSLRLGNITFKQFQGREKARKNYLLNHGYLIIEFTTNDDILPNDDKILELYNKALELFKQGCKFYTCNLTNFSESFE